MEELDFYLDAAEEMMDKAIDHLQGALIKIRAGKAMPSMLEGIMVEYYGTPTPINQMASITTPDARTLFIKPWEKNVIPEVERAIINSDLGLNPQNDGEQVIINIPPLTEERRITLVKQAKHEGEQGKVSIRSARHDCQHHLKQLQKEGTSEDDVRTAEDKLDALTEKYSKNIDELIKVKEDEIMTV